MKAIDAGEISYDDPREMHLKNKKAKEEEAKDEDGNGLESTLGAAMRARRKAVDSESEDEEDWN